MELGDEQHIVEERACKAHESTLVIAAAVAVVVVVVVVYRIEL